MNVLVEMFHESPDTFLISHESPVNLHWLIKILWFPWIMRKNPHHLKATQVVVKLANYISDPNFDISQAQLSTDEPEDLFKFIWAAMKKTLMTFHWILIGVMPGSPNNGLL